MIAVGLCLDIRRQARDRSDHRYRRRLPRQTRLLREYAEHIGLNPAFTIHDREDSADRERREKATAKAQAALDKAEREHAKKAADIHAEVEAIEKRSQAEDDRWEKERGRLQAALRRARE
jgi:flagellar motility protein MotE (MotC chaperone)